MGKVIGKHKLELLAFSRVALILIFIGWLPSFAPELSEVVYGSISDAYVGVSTWVALTLAVFYIIEKSLKIDFARVMQHHKKWQVVIAGLMGGLPGCGGAIVITTQYVRGYASFGSLVATLTATMGDAAFLLIASTPKMAIIVIGLGIIIGIITGYIVDLLPTSKWLVKDKQRKPKPAKNPTEVIDAWFWGAIDSLWILLLIPGVMLTFSNALNIDINYLFLPIYNGFGEDLSVFIGSLTLAIFFASPSENNPLDITCQKLGIVRRVVAETAFISAWVVLGFVLYDVAIYAFNWDLKVLFSTLAPIVPLIGVLIGWLPGCGPQIVVTTLYINGIIPFSALMGNAISNDGDALFPTLVLSPRAGVLATAYSTVPALIVAYTIYFIWEI